MTHAGGLPAVDAQDMETGLAGFAQQLGLAWTETGFVAVTGHGIDPSIIETCRRAAQDLFALPLETKMGYHIEGGGGQRGYTPFGVETAKDASIPDRKEFWHVGRDLPFGDPRRAMIPDNLWPEDLDDFRDTCLSFFNAMDTLGRRLLAAVAIYLGQDERYFENRVAGGNSILRLLHYPPLETDAPGERAAAHGDINVITLLTGADQEGLEILRRDGEWVSVHVDSSAIVCNVGDMLVRLTNTVLPSTTHRVVRPTGALARLPRYSMPYFLHFAPEVEIKTLPNCISGANPDHYPSPITARDFLAQRLAEIGLT